MTKRCPSCGETKSASEFGRNKSLGGGLSFYCLTCNRARNNKWYRDHRRSLGKDVRDHTWIPEGFRWCPSCEQAVAHEDYTRNSGTASGFGSRCRACDRAANSAGYFYRKYRLTPTELAELRLRQQDRCAICGDPSPQHLDHDHATGRLRQLLCQRCNHGLGLFRDDPVLLHAAAYYVTLHRTHQEIYGPRPTIGTVPDTAGRPGDPPGAADRRPGGRRTGRNRRRAPAPDGQD